VNSNGKEVLPVGRVRDNLVHFCSLAEKNLEKDLLGIKNEEKFYNTQL
jgi:hypothetical protein